MTQLVTAPLQTTPLLAVLRSRIVRQPFQIRAAAMILGITALLLVPSVDLVRVCALMLATRHRYGDRAFTPRVLGFLDWLTGQKASY